VSEIYPVETNIVIFDLDESESVADFLQYLKNNQVLAIQFGPKTVRMVTHLDVSNKMIDDVIEVLKSYI
jgi:threonine aldolase